MPDQQETFRPYLDVDQPFSLAPTSARRMRELDRLRMDAAMTGDEARRRLAEEYCLEIDEDESGRITSVDGKAVPTVAKDHFYTRAAEIIFEGAESGRGEEVNVAVVRRALGKFDLAGSEHLQRLAGGLTDSMPSPPPQNQTTTT
jgi:hypothetical protein